jgi:hypothetical protein
MKNIYLLVFLVALLGCSKEKIQQKQEDLVVKAMTEGQWKVTNFVKNGTDLTSDYSTYAFKFNTNLTVDAINNGTLERSGTWNADANAQTITSLFPGVSSVPVGNLHGTWKITSTTWTSVNATQTVGTEVKILRLDKL